MKLKSRHRFRAENVILSETGLAPSPVHRLRLVCNQDTMVIPDITVKYHLCCNEEGILGTRLQRHRAPLLLPITLFVADACSTLTQNFSIVS